MYNLISWYNQNRRKIWITILTAIGVFLIAWRLMFMWNGSRRIITPEISKEDISSNMNTVTLTSQKSAITGKNTQVDKKGITVIDNFVSFCNSGNLQSAYNLLTNECKEEMFPNISRFQEIYYNPIFLNGKRTSKIENWIGDIYIIDYEEDALSTGIYSTENTIRDYITINKDKENNYKININKYIGRTEINKTAQKGDLQVTVIRKDAYMDYEKYTIEFKNGSNSPILIAKLQDDDNVSYLMDKNNLKYNAAATELTEEQMNLAEEQSKTLKIKYYNPYGSLKDIKRLVFPKIYMSYQAYQAYTNKNNYNNYETISIEI